jgi:muconolactone delta-isomerase
MKFLILARPRPSPLPPQALAAMLTATRDWLKQRQARGEFDALFSFVDGGGGAIGNYDSHEALNAAIQEYPLNPITDWQIYPLCDFDKSIELGIKVLQQMGG